MQMSQLNIDYKNILMSKSMKMVGKSKKTDWIKRRKEPKFGPRSGKSPQNFARVAGI